MFARIRKWWHLRKLKKLFQDKALPGDPPPRVQVPLDLWNNDERFAEMERERVVLIIVRGSNEQH